MAVNDQRSARLNRLLDTVLKGKTNLGTSTQCKQFIEAICLQPDPPLCVENIIAGPCGISSIQEAICIDVSVSGLHEHGVNLLSYMQAPAIKTLNGGRSLTLILNSIAESSNFWMAFIAAFKEKKLTEVGQRCFAWALLHLIRSPDCETISSHLTLAEEIEPILLGSPYIDVRNLGQKIKHAISSPSITTAQDGVTPGGRHDNDFVDFRDITILPTADELASTEVPFLRPSAALDDPYTEETREELYLDNQFRLLREDMIHEMREELQNALGPQRGKGFVVEGLHLVGCVVGPFTRRVKWSLVLQCEDEFSQFRGMNLANRKAWLKKHPRFLKHQSLASLIVDGEVLAFPTVRRQEELLVTSEPQIVLELEGGMAMQKLLLQIKSAAHVKLIQIDVAVFAYEPILNALKSMRYLPLSTELLFWEKDSAPGLLTFPYDARRLETVTDHVRFGSGADVGELVGLPKIVLDAAQQRSLISGLTQKLSIIQGPPGTGKSFIGALLAKFIYTFSRLKILVVCYTNHALDQFLEALLDVDISSASMVRIGGKSTTRTEPMLIQKQGTNFRFSRADNFAINDLKVSINFQAICLTSAFRRYLQSSTGDAEIMAHLESEEKEFYTAFKVPKSDDGMKMMGKGGRVVDEFYLIRRWQRGGDAEMFSNEPNVLQAHEIWSMPKASRQAIINQWVEKIRTEEVERLCETASQYNEIVDELDRKFKEKDGYILKYKRIIGCTTTAAAKYTSKIREAAPDVVLVEEAGEILESHVITALGHSAKQLILIGDHKQLRPKVNNYNLTVEKGEGYDLNMSLFERLVRKGYPHETLVSQHRMRPEISSIIRHLTYPDLQDAPKTKGRPDLRGVQDNIIFINHDHPEDELFHIADTRDMGSKSSKQNRYEARMTLKIVKYLAQQGYGTENMVVLTPYLGQLRKLQGELEAENDPVLNDLDSYDLIRAGLLFPGDTNTTKRRLRLATIDNYQGEESDIVIASLTRSNADNDIGFMIAPERLNVLLSRARNGLILLGNSSTFMKSKKGGALWQEFFKHIQGHVYDGFPVKCERHPHRTAILSSEVQFEQHCPDGGCAEPCGTTLTCGLHDCPSKCHQLYDHSKMQCEEIVAVMCPKGHDQSKKCFEPILPRCKKCDREVEVAEAKRQREFSLQQKRDEEEAEHLRTMKRIEEQLMEQQLRHDNQLIEEREDEIRPSSSSSIFTTSSHSPGPSPRDSPFQQSKAWTSWTPAPPLQYVTQFPETVKILQDSGEISGTSDGHSFSEVEWRGPSKQQLKTPQSPEGAVWSAAFASKKKRFEEGFKEELPLVLQNDRVKRDELKRERESQSWREVAAQREQLEVAPKAHQEAHEKDKELEAGQGTLLWRLRSSASPIPASHPACFFSSAQPPFRPFRSPASPTPAGRRTGLYVPPHRQT